MALDARVKRNKVLWALQIYVLAVIATPRFVEVLVVDDIERSCAQSFANSNARLLAKFHTVIVSHGERMQYREIGAHVRGMRVTDLVIDDIVKCWHQVLPMLGQFELSAVEVSCSHDGMDTLQLLVLHVFSCVRFACHPR